MRFTTDLRIPPTNNLSERDPRPNKTQQHISGRFTSDEITTARLTLASYVRSARKSGQNALTALLGLFTGTPWTPSPAPG